MTKYCYKCGHENQDHATYCVECGANIIEDLTGNVYCSCCGQLNNETTKFCGNCGAKLITTTGSSKTNWRNNRYIYRINSANPIHIIIGLSILTLIIGTISFSFNYLLFELFLIFVPIVWGGYFYIKKEYLIASLEFVLIGIYTFYLFYPFNYNIEMLFVAIILFIVAAAIYYFKGKGNYNKLALILPIATVFLVDVAFYIGVYIYYI